jgi:hypothetical protein
MESKLEGKVVKIRPLVKETFSGLSSYPKSGFSFGCELDGKTGYYKNGLTKEQETYYEDKLQLPKGTLAKTSPWWANIIFKFSRSKVTNFIITTPTDEVKYYVLLATSKVCNNELEKSKWPHAYFMIVDEEAVAQVDAKDIDLEFEAMKAMYDSDNQRGLLKVLTGKHGIENMSEAAVKSQLVKELKADPKRFLETVNNKQLKTRILIEDLLEFGIIVKQGNYYKNGDDPIGNSTEEVISYFDNLKNSSVALALEQKLKQFKRVKAAAKV